MDWREGLAKFADQADIIIGSPPCQGYSEMTDCEPEAKERRSRDIAEMRDALIATGKPYVIENVRGAARDHELRDPIRLCGWTFGYEVFRERYFEAGGGLVLCEPAHREHYDQHGSKIKAGRSGRFGDKPGYSEPGRFVSAVGCQGNMELYREVMGVPEWMTADEVTECIPPYMAKYIAHQALEGTVPEIPDRQPGPLAQRLIWDAREHQDGTSGSRDSDAADDLRAPYGEAQDDRDTGHREAMRAEGEAFPDEDECTRNLEITCRCCGRRIDPRTLTGEEWRSLTGQVRAA